MKCKALAENAQRDLDEALPALEEAMKVRHPQLTACRLLGFLKPCSHRRSLPKALGTFGGIAKVAFPLKEPGSKLSSGNIILHPKKTRLLR